MNGFTYTLILEEPVLANSLSGDTNSARSLPFIPGGLVRGAMINKYNGKKEADDKDFQRLFLDGTTRFLHAYPVCNDQRMLPTPVAWKTYKDDFGGTRGVENFAAKIIDDPELKHTDFPFYIIDDDTIFKARHEWQVNVHTQRDAVYGRAKGAGKGAVYRYEALPAGLHLSGVILADDEADAKELKDLLNDPIMLGKARTAGYGRVRVETSEIFSDWREDTSSDLPTGKTNKFTITFLSDAVLRDANGQVTLDPIPALQAIFKVNDLKGKHTFHKMETVGGFNRKWGMPLPQSQALAAGSVIVIESASGIEAKALEQLENSGLGERTAEGFGRVAVSVSSKKDFKLGTGKLKFETKIKASLLPAEEPVADLMLKRLLRRELDEKMLSAVIVAVNEYKGGVKNSQLSRWRVNLRSAIGAPEKGLDKMREFYKKEDARNSPSWQKMTRARVKIGNAPVRLTEWMDTLLKDPAGVWSMIGYAQAPEKKLGTRPFNAKNMNVEYSLRLMDAVMASMSKKNAEGGQDGN
ncbi:MAG TPA: hypothetical protein VJ972_08895 [Anaerolineales bacterium]|nr:hypothetical protein [Anaerolineales bacterium]